MIFKINGKNVGELNNGIFFKEVKFSKHFFRKAKAFGVSAEIIGDLRKNDCHTIRIIDTENKEIWETPFEMFDAKSWLMQFPPHEPQKFLAQERWNITTLDGELIQAMKPVTEPDPVAMPPEIQAIEDEYTKLKTDFKPQFGNQTHINIAKGYDEVNKLEKELSKKEAASKGAETLRRDIVSKKKNIIFWMKKI